MLENINPNTDTHLVTDSEFFWPVCRTLRRYAIKIQIGKRDGENARCELKPGATEISEGTDP